MCRGMHTGERGDNIIMSRKGISARAPEQRERARPRLRMAHAPRCTWYSHRTMRREAQDGKSTPNADRHGTPTPPHSNTLLHEITARATSISARAAAATQQRERARPRSRMARPALHLVQPPHDASGASRPAPCFDASGASSPHITRRRCARGGRTVPRARSGPAGGAPAGRETGRFAHAHTRRSAPRAPPPRRREVSRQTALHCAHTKCSTEQKFRILRTLCAQRALLAISGERHSPVGGTARREHLGQVTAGGQLTRRRAALIGERHARGENTWGR